MVIRKNCETCGSEFTTYQSRISEGKGRFCSRVCRSSSEPMVRRLDVRSRLLNGRQINKETDCWEWTKAKFDNGYGAIGVTGKTMRVHRVSYQLHKGDIPDGMLVCHSCDNPKCFNPDHLFLGSESDNSADMVTKRRSKKPGAKITQSIADSIKARLVAGESCASIARDVGITRESVSSIKNGKSWR